MNNKGFVLIAVLAIAGIITTLAVGFIYTVQTHTSLLSSFADSSKAYSMARSGLLAGLAVLKENMNSNDPDLRLPEEIVIKNPYPFEKDLVLKVEDESGKFNLNSLVFPSGAKDTEALADFKRLLKYLNLSEDIAEKTVVWIRRGTFDQSEKKSGVQVFRLESTDEILLASGITRPEFALLEPYVTVVGDAMVNINTAGLPVLMSLSPKITEDMAERIRSFRVSSLFIRTSDIVKVPGFSNSGVDLIGKISVTSSFLKLKITVSYKDINKEVCAIVRNMENRMVVESWREI
ncbi:MAG: general secretion pathway protein GspK [Candidatus Omnitrophica bacterium]|nr:general secretion pathway protein GspK [Candidatus Omnitrophota bacterium]